MKRTSIILLAVMALICFGFMASAYADSLQELQAKAAKMRIGVDGDTEATVRALMGEPTSETINERIIAGGARKYKRLAYGPPEGEVVVIINLEYGHVQSVK